MENLPIEIQEDIISMSKLEILKKCDLCCRDVLSNNFIPVCSAHKLFTYVVYGSHIAVCYKENDIRYTHIVSDKCRSSLSTDFITFKHLNGEMQIDVLPRYIHANGKIFDNVPGTLQQIFPYTLIGSYTFCMLCRHKLSKSFRKWSQKIRICPRAPPSLEY